MEISKGSKQQVKRFFSLAAVLVLVPFLLVACGGDDDDNGATTTPAATETPGNTQANEAPDGTATTEPTKAAEPSPTAEATTKTVTDDLDREVEVPAKAERVVALSPTIVELMYADGATPVGRPDSATYPPEADIGARFRLLLHPEL